jgi:hypothetical protein
MTDLATLAATVDCTTLQSRYTTLLDAYRFDEFLELWTDDAELSMFGQTYRGKAEIRGWLESRPADMLVRHLVTNSVIDPVSETEASGFCYTTVFRVDGALGKEPAELGVPTFVVDYRSTFRLDPGHGWRFARRDATAIFLGPEQLAAMAPSR